MRAALVQALRDYFPDADDATGDPATIVSPGVLPFPDPERLTRLLLRALREIEQDRQADRQAVVQALQALTARVAALEAKVP